jgi:hypothetical protein
MLTQIRIQNLRIIRWIVSREEQLTKINLDSKKKTYNRLKSVLIWNLLSITN